MTKRRARRGRRSPGHRRYDRMDRVNELVREIVADRLAGLSDPRLELVTITGAEVTNDLALATIYWAALGGTDDDHVDEAAAGLDSARAVLRSAVGSEARLRQTPELRFVLDPAIAAGARVEEILRDLHGSEDPSMEQGS